MTAQELLDDYSILKDKTMTLPRKSILASFGKDKYDEDRAFMIELFNSFSEDDGDDFFYEMISNIMYIHKNPEQCVAYTSPDRIISLNYPTSTNVVPMDDDRFQKWYFIYCHECLHQMWNTFAVGDKIKKEGKYFDHNLLNIASDCVINDFLANINTSHKIIPNHLVTPQAIEEKYGVHYNNRTDDQYMLYCKIIDSLTDEQKEELKKEWGGEIEPKKITKKQGPPPPPPPPGGKKYPKEFVDGWTDAIQDTLDKKIDPRTWQPNDSWIKSHSKLYVDGYTKAVAQIKEGLENGITITKKPSGPPPPGGRSNLPPIPWKLPPDGGAGDDDDEDKKDPGDPGDDEQEGKDKDKDNEDELPGEPGDDDDDSEETEGKSKDQTDDEGNEEGDLLDSNIDDYLIDYLRRHAEKICKKYANSISSGLRPFLDKCRSAWKLKNPAELRAQSPAGKQSWKKEVTLSAKGFVRQKLKNETMWKRTYEKQKRGGRAITSADLKKGVILTPGRKRIKNSTAFDICLYIDISGSMSAILDSVFKSAYSIVDELLRNFGGIKEIDKKNIKTRVFVFDTQMIEISYGKATGVGNSTYEFDKLIHDIHKNGTDALVNIIITDGEFSSIDVNKVANEIKDLPGMFELVTNSPQGTFDKVVHKVTQLCHKPQLHVVYVDSFDNP